MEEKRAKGMQSKRYAIDSNGEKNQNQQISIRILNKFKSKIERQRQQHGVKRVGQPFFHSKREKKPTNSVHSWRCVTGELL